MATSGPSLGRRFWLLASARTISVAGNGFGRVALAFGVLTLPGATPASLSLVLACQALPQLLLVLVGGVIADRFSRARLLVAAEAVAAIAWLGLLAVIAERDSELWQLCALAALAGAASALFTPAMNGVIPELVPHDQLQRANGLVRVGQNLALLSGLAAAGTVVAVFGAPWAILLNGCSFILSGALIASIRLPSFPRRPESFLADLREGGRAFFSHQWLWVVVAQYAFVVAAVNATVGVLGPLTFDHRIGGAAAWGLVTAGQALGTIAGAGIATRIRSRRPIRLAVLVTFLFAPPMLLLALGAPVWCCAATMLVSGVANDVIGVLWQTTMQEQIPRHLLSRVSAYDTFGSLAFAPLGLAVAGPLAAAIGIRTALDGCAALILLVTAAALLAPQVRRLAPRPVPGPRHEHE